MTAAEHRDEAEKLLQEGRTAYAKSAEYDDRGDMVMVEECLTTAACLFSWAQVHATLATIPDAEPSTTETFQ